MCTEVGEKMSEKEIVFCKSGGCTAKLGAGVLEHILERLPKGKKDENLYFSLGLLWLPFQLLRGNQRRKNALQLRSKFGKT